MTTSSKAKESGGVMPDAGTHYLDIETTGPDPRKDGVLTIQYVELERGAGRPPSEIAILKEWERG